MECLTYDSFSASGNSSSTSFVKSRSALRTVDSDMVCSSVEV
jgi:hypothetical protein